MALQSENLFDTGKVLSNTKDVHDIAHDLFYLGVAATGHENYAVDILLESGIPLCGVISKKGSISEHTLGEPIVSEVIIDAQLSGLLLVGCPSNLIWVSYKKAGS